MEEYSDKSVKTILKELESFETGLSTKEAEKRLKSNGKNELTGEKQPSFLYSFFKGFCDFSIIILIIAGVISFLISFLNGENDITDTAVIFTIIILNAFIGALQEKKAEKSLSALKKISSPTATVLRNKKETKIPSTDIVKGDVLVLSSGDLVPADARLLDSVGLKTDESALTGEALPIEKNHNTVLKKNTPIAERINSVFSGTLVVSGHGKALVTSTGMNTEIGKIADMLKVKEESTPLQKRLSKLSQILGIGALICCVIIFLIGVIRKNDILSSFMLAVSLSVAAIPEGLPAIVTIVLSRGVGRLSSKGAIIKHLPSCETLGNATFICSDKTGTLTKNKMTVTEINIPYISKNALNSKESIYILKCASLCTNCSISSKWGKSKVLGEPTEAAIVSEGLKNGINLKTENARYNRIKEIPFDSARKMMTVINRTENGYLTVSKGSPEHLIKKCRYIKIGNNIKELTQNHIKEIEKLNEKMALNALRVLAVAEKRENTLSSEAEGNLVFLGLIGMEDPPRRDVIKSIKKCKEAGITTVMITGDQLLTANVIAERLGISEKGTLSVDGNTLDKMSDEELRQDVKNIRVFARVTPTHKMRIVKALKDLGETVAMTGDGINDAPALKSADIGCAMGKNGTEVAKSSADLILTDDNFSTIVTAIEIGRGLFDNIKKAVRFLLSCNIGEIMLIFISSIMGFPAPLLPVQLLWLNLVTDSFPAMALGIEKEEENIMKRAPAKKSEGIISKTKAYDIAVEGLLFGAISLIAFILGKNMFSLETGRTMAFCTLSFLELWHALNVRSEKSVFTISPFENPQLLLSTAFCVILQVLSVVLPVSNKIFDTVPLNKEQWITVILLSLVSLIVTELEKFIGRRKLKN